MADFHYPGNDWSAGKERLPGAESGQSSIEYIIVAFVVAMILMAGDPSPIAQLMNALRTFYQDYSWALSLAAIP